MNGFDLDKIGSSLVEEGFLSGVSTLSSSSIINDLEEESLDLVSEVSSKELITDVFYRDLLPVGSKPMLGLDLSLSSCGIAIVDVEGYSSSNYTIVLSPEEESSPHYDYYLRRNLKQHLTSLFAGWDFSVIIVEDVFAGVNAKTVRQLTAINSAIDELVFEGVISCDEFLRLDNNVWKSWLFGFQPSWGIGLNDKFRIKGLLEGLGIIESGAGHQDRLDALGMLFAHRIKTLGYTSSESGSATEKHSYSWSSVALVALPASIEDGELSQYIPKYVLEGRKLSMIVETRRLLSRKRILEDLEVVGKGGWIIYDTAHRGYDYLLEKLGLSAGGRYLACWFRK